MLLIHALRHPRDGIVLLLVSGVLAFLLLLAAMIVHLTRVQTAGTDAGAAGRAARIAAESGMDYAAARLMENPYPAGAFPRDDWTARGDEPDSTPPSRLLNPSFPHGEPWSDSEPPGSPGHGFFSNDPFDDVNGNGLYDVRSGRLRGREEFALRIRSPGAKLPVNAGALAPPNHNKPTHAANKPLRNVLCALGAVVLAPNPAIGREDKPAGTAAQPGEDIRLSKLGDHLIAMRPAGGYANLDAVGAALKKNGYSASERDQVIPFLTVLLDQRPEQGGIPVTNPDGAYCEPPIEAWSVPHEILQAIWLYQQSNCLDADQISCLFPAPWSQAGLLETTPFGSPGVRSGGSIDFGLVSSAVPYRRIMIYPDEAKALADWFVDYRRENTLWSWVDLRQDLVARAPGIFKTECDMLTPVDPDIARAWARAKADLAFFATTLEMPSFKGFSAWADWGLHHGYAGYDGPFFSFHFPLKSARVRETGWTFPSTIPYETYSGTDPLFPTLTLAPPTRFDAEASGTLKGPSGTPRAEATARGLLVPAERIAFTSQEDFENYGIDGIGGGAGLLANHGIRVDDPFPETRRPVTANGGYAYPMVASVPCRNLRGEPSVPNIDKKYSRLHGALELAPCAFGPEGAGQYWPILEDHDSASGTPLAEYASWPSGSNTPIALSAPPAWIFPVPELGDAFKLSYTDIAELPGMKPAGPPVHPIEMTVSFWTRHGGATYEDAGPLISNLVIGCGSNVRLDLTLAGGWDAGTLDKATGALGIKITPGLNMWPILTSAPPSASYSGTPLGEVFFPLYSTAKGATLSDWHLVALTVQSVSADESRYTLYLDGDLFNPVSANGPCICNPAWGKYSVTTRNADEVRLHDKVLTPEEINAIWRKGRYVNPASPGATFTSPKYVLGEESRLLRAGWLGLPSGDKDAAGDPLERVTMDVAVRGYDAGGTLLWTAPLLGSDAVTPLYTQKRIAAFDYVVTFTGDGVTPLYRTPRFESIWFQFDRKGRAGKYLSWGPGGDPGPSSGGLPPGGGGGGGPPPGGGPPGGGGKPPPGGFGK